MNDFLTIAHMAAAADTSVAQIQGWIARGQFVPERTTTPGVSRRFGLDDATRLAIM